MSMSGLGSLLQRESASIRTALPAGLNEMFWPSAPRMEQPSAVVAQTVEKERPSLSWLAAIALAALALGFFWLFTHGRRPTAPIAPVASGTANRVATGLGDFVKLTLPGNVNLTIPEKGVETRLLAFIQNPDATPDRATWFDFDRLAFNTGSAQLRPESQEQLNNIAMILLAYPGVHMKVGGYTDNVGGTEHNLKLSQERASTVVAELVRRGVAPDRLTAEGYGEQYPMADNSTEQGRAQNRRVSMHVTQK
jgi:outer membrane protein OmpA-like peptidoglycan-associated protein